jgi:arginine repressor
MATDNYHDRIGNEWHNKEAQEFLKKANDILTKPELYDKLRNDFINEFEVTRAFIYEHNIKTQQELVAKVNGLNKSSEI